MDHAEIGMRLAKHRELPPDLVNGIGYHHDPQNAEPDYRVPACVIHTAAQLVRRAGTPSFDGDTDMALLESAMDHLHLDPRRADKVVSTIMERLKSVQF